MARLDAAEFGAPREAVLNALRAEGIPCSAGYGWTLPRQPVFRDKAFGPYLPHARSRLDYTAQADRCVNADLLCEQAIWLEQSLMLGSHACMEDIAYAFEKVHEHRDALTTARR
jgi:perosamine synthetase